MNLTEPNAGHGFSRSALLKRLAGDEELCDQLISIFVETVDEDLSELRDILNRNEYHGIPSLAHKIKGACLNVGARGISDIMQTIESSAKSGVGMDHVQPLVGKARGLLSEMAETNETAKDRTGKDG